MTGDGNPLIVGVPFFFAAGVSSAYSGASLLGAGVKLEVDFGASGKFMTAGRLGNALTGKTSAAVSFFWKKFAMED